MSFMDTIKTKAVEKWSSKYYEEVKELIERKERFDSIYQNALLELKRVNSNEYKEYFKKKIDSHIENELLYELENKVDSAVNKLFYKDYNKSEFIKNIVKEINKYQINK